MCHSPETLTAYRDGRLPADEADAVEARIESCPDCLRAMDHLVRREELAAWFPPGVPPEGSVEVGPEDERIIRELLALPRAEPTLDILGPSDHEGDLGRLGRFRVREVLGKGGMGVVLGAIDMALGRAVALKVLKPRCDDDRGRARFLREARAAARIRHDHVVTVFEAGEACGGGAPFLVMERIDGPTLHHRIHGNPADRPGPEEAARVVEQAALGLQAAHDAGLIHRDVTPRNILLDRATGRAKVSDFGLVRDAIEPGATTRAGHLLGTPPYLSPEQLADPGSVDRRTDVYALGVVLYEALTGAVPFRGTSDQALRRQIEADEPLPPRRLNPDVPRDLDTICLKCLEKDPRRRYDTAADLAADLRRFLGHEPIAARPVGRAGRLRRRCRRHPVSAGLAAALLITFIVAAVGIGLGYREALRQRDRAREYLGKTLGALEVLLREATQIQGVEIPQVARARDRLANEGLRYYREISQIEQDDPTVRSAQARALQSLAGLHRTLGRPAERERALRQSLSIWENMPDSGRVEHESAGCHLALADLLMTQRGRLAEAGDHLRRAGALASRLEGAARLRALVEQRRLYGAWHRIQGSDEAEGPFREAVAYAEELVSGFPHAPDHIKEAASCYAALGNCLFNPPRGDREGAAGAYRRGIELLDTIGDLSSDENYESLSAKGTLLRDLARCLRVLEQLPEARARYEQARSIFERRTRDYPSVPLYHSELGEVIHGIAITGAKIDPPERTLQLLGQALEQARAAYQADPSNHSFRTNLLHKWGFLADLHMRAKRHADAAHALGEFLPLAFRTYDFAYAASLLLKCESLALADAALAPEERASTARLYHDRAREAFRVGVEEKGLLEPLRKLTDDDASLSDFRGSKPLQGLLRELGPPGEAAASHAPRGMQRTASGPS